MKVLSEVRRRKKIMLAIVCLVLISTAVEIVYERITSSHFRSVPSIAYIAGEHSKDNPPKLMLYQNGRSRCIGKFSKRFQTNFIYVIGYDREHRRWICQTLEDGCIISMGEDGEHIIRLKDLTDDDILRTATFIDNYIWIRGMADGNPSISKYSLDGSLLSKIKFDMYGDAVNYELGYAAISKDELVALSLSKGICIFDKTGKLVSVVGHGRYPMFDSSGSKLLFTSDDHHAEIYDMKTRKLKHLNIDFPSYKNVFDLLPVPVVNLVSFKWGAKPNTFVVEYFRMWPGRSAMYFVEQKGENSFYWHQLPFHFEDGWIVMPDAKVSGKSH